MAKTILPENYKPSEDEEYMNPLQLEYFRQKLVVWRKELLTKLIQDKEEWREKNWHEPDLSDMATVENEAFQTLRDEERKTKLIHKIESTIIKIDQGEYGYCDETGEPIGIGRLEARPVATLCIEAQERHESHEKSHSEE